MTKRWWILLIVAAVHFVMCDAADSSKDKAQGSDESGGDGDADGDMDGDSDGDADGDSDGDADTDTDSDGDIDSDTETQSDSESETESESDSESATETETEGDTESESETDDELFIDRIYEIPNYCQLDPDYGSFPGNGTNYCGPAAVSNPLMWLDDRGYDNLAENSGDRFKDQHDVIYTLGSQNYMNTDPNGGTSANQVLRGMDRLVQEAGYTPVRLSYQGWRLVDNKYQTGVTRPDFDWIKAGVRGARRRLGEYWLVQLQCSYRHVHP